MRLFDVTIVGSGLLLAGAILLPPLGGRREPAPPVADRTPAPAAAEGQAPGETRPGGLSDEEIEQCLRVAREVDPDLAVRLERIRRQRPHHEFARALRNARHLVSLARLKEQDPRLYDAKLQELRIDARVDAVLAKLKAARRRTSADAAEIERELRRLVEQKVGYELVARGLYLSRLKEHVESLQEQLSEDLANFPEAVERRLERLLQRAETAEAPGG